MGFSSPVQLMNSPVKERLEQQHVNEGGDGVPNTNSEHFDFDLWIKMVRHQMLTVVQKPVENN